MKKISVSAPGKLMLFGEHAVVYDRPCLVTAVSSRMKTTIKKTTGQSFKIEAPQVKDVRFVEETVRTFQKRFGLGNGLAIKTESDFSCQYGFGSSSAVTVATLSGLGKLFDVFLSKKEIFNLGYQVTLSIQGLGSGFDIAAATYGGTLYFVTGGKEIESLSINDLPLVVGYSGTKADTPTLVRRVRLELERQKKRVKEIFNEIALIVEEAKKELERKNWLRVGQLMNNNQKLLQSLKVSTPKLDQMCQASLNAGAFGAKLSGAGGGDCMIALVDKEKRKKVIKAIEGVGGQIIKVKTAEQGVRDESYG